MPANLLLVAAIAASSLELRAEIVDGHTLRVLLVPQGPVPIVTTARTTLGCYVEVDVQDPEGVLIGYLGPRATCAIPQLSEFRSFRPDDSSSSEGAEILGTEFDLLAPERVRIGPDENALQSRREYRFIVKYHNDDATVIGAKGKTVLQKRFGRFWLSTFRLESKPISFTWAQ